MLRVKFDVLPTVLQESELPFTFSVKIIVRTKATMEIIWRGEEREERGLERWRGKLQKKNGEKGEKIKK